MERRSERFFCFALKIKETITNKLNLKLVLQQSILFIDSIVIDMA